MNNSSAGSVIDRLKLLYQAKNDTELCSAAGINRQTLSNWKSRDTVPYSLCVSLASEKGVTLDWLLTGDGPMRREEPAENLSPKEEAVLALFRALDDDAQREIQQVAAEKKRLRDVEQRLEELSSELALSKNRA